MLSGLDAERGSWVMLFLFFMSFFVSFNLAVMEAHTWVAHDCRTVVQTYGMVPIVGRRFVKIEYLLE